MGFAKVLRNCSLQNRLPDAFVTFCSNPFSDFRQQKTILTGGLLLEQNIDENRISKTGTPKNQKGAATKKQVRFKRAHLSDRRQSGFGNYAKAAFL